MPKIRDSSQGIPAHEKAYKTMIVCAKNMEQALEKAKFRFVNDKDHFSQVRSGTPTDPDPYLASNGFADAYIAASLTAGTQTEFEVRYLPHHFRALVKPHERAFAEQITCPLLILDETTAFANEVRTVVSQTPVFSPVYCQSFSALEAELVRERQKAAYNTLTPWPLILVNKHMIWPPTYSSQRTVLRQLEALTSPKVVYCTMFEQEMLRPLQEKGFVRAFVRDSYFLDPQKFIGVLDELVNDLLNSRTPQPDPVRFVC